MKCFEKNACLVSDEGITTQVRLPVYLVDIKHDASFPYTRISSQFSLRMR